uniref:Uncharacterized protein n=1 Tax=Pipistrellus kuhlii TaxID=59472 RepID=A0A7J8B2E5_PIPKU|nr:hypothetical protein mPipKuh1_007832 [Pipistrellus kuhlii]
MPGVPRWLRMFLLCVQRKRQGHSGCANLLVSKVGTFFFKLSLLLKVLQMSAVGVVVVFLRLSPLPAAIPPKPLPHFCLCPWAMHISSLIITPTFPQRFISLFMVLCFWIYFVHQFILFSSFHI